VYDLAARRRVLRIPVVSPVVSFMAHQAGIDRDSTTRWLLEKVLPNTGVDAIAVTQDDKPVLVAAGMVPPTVTVHDAMTGDVVREISEVGLALSLLSIP